MDLRRGQSRDFSAAGEAGVGRFSHIEIAQASVNVCIVWFIDFTAWIRRPDKFLAKE